VWLRGVDRSRSAQPQPLTRRLSLLPLLLPLSADPHHSPTAVRSIQRIHSRTNHTTHTTAVDMSQLSTGEDDADADRRLCCCALPLATSIECNC